jgi:hypothetical protein
MRRVFLICWAASAALIVAGWLGDTRDYWSDKPFLTNLASSFAGALFGIPVAVILVQRFAVEQSTYTQERAVMRKVAACLNNLYSAASDMANRDIVRLSKARSDLVHARDQVGEANTRQPVPDATRRKIDIAIDRLRQSIVDPAEYAEIAGRVLLYTERYNALRDRGLESGASWAEHVAAIEAPPRSSPLVGDWVAQAVQQAGRPISEDDFYPEGELPAAKALRRLDDGVYSVGTVITFFKSVRDARQELRRMLREDEF